MGLKSLSGVIAVYLLLPSTVHAANNIDVNVGSDLTNISGSPSFVSTDDSAILGVDQLTGVWSANTSSTVSVSTSTSGTNLQDGDINFNGSLDYNGPNYSSKTLNFSAHNNINISGSIFDSNNLQTNYLNLNLTPDNDATGGGMAYLSGSIDKVSATINGDLNILSAGIFDGSLTANNVINDGQVSSHNTHISNNLSLNTGSSYDASGWFEAGSVTQNGGSFNYTGHVFHLTNGGLAVDSNGLLGASVTGLQGIEVSSMSVGTASADSGDVTIDKGSASQAGVTVNGALTINAGGTVDIVSGGLYVDSIDNSAGGNFTYTEGVLYILNQGVVIGNSGLLGNNVTISDDRHLGAKDLTVESGASLTVTGGYNVFSSVSGGATAENIGTDFIDNFGTITVTGGLLGNNDPFTNHSGATFNLNGGQLSVGSISNAGTFNYTGGNLTVFYSDLNISDIANNSGNLTVNSSMNVGADGHNIVIGTGNTLTLNGGNIYANNIISGGGTLNFASGSLGVDSLSIGSGGLLGSNVTLNSSKSLSANNINVASGSSLSVNDGALNVLNVTNSGTVAIDSNGLNLGGGFGTYTQNAGSTTVDGVLTADTVDIQGGTLKGSGMIIGNTVIGDGGILNAGNSPGSLNLDGGLTLTENGTLHFEIDGNMLSGFDFDQLIFNPNKLDPLLFAFEGGDILFDLFDGVEITDLISSFDINSFFVGDEFSEFGLFQFLGYDALANVSLLASDGEFNYILGLDESDGSFSVVSVSSVPVPAAVWLFGSGLIGLIGVARRKKK